jgi:hypothetical protein
MQVCEPDAFGLGFGFLEAAAAADLFLEMLGFGRRRI